MKTKGTTAIERHAEKIVLAVFLIGALGVLLLQVGLIFGRQEIQVAGKPRPLDRALASVGVEAQQRRVRLESDQVAAGLPATLPDPVAVFEQALASSQAVPAPMAALGASPIRLDALGSAGTVPVGLPVGDADYAMPAPPPPSAPIAEVFEGTVDPLVVAEVGRALASLLPPEQPHDARIISVQASFDAAALRRSIERPPSESVSPIPGALWQGRVEIVDVEWSRQELTADGTWGPETVLAPLPGRNSLRDLATKAEPQPADFADMLEKERTFRQDIRRPAFYPTISGHPWLWPAQTRAESQRRESEEVIALRRDLAKVRNDIKILRKQIEDLDRPTRRPPVPPDRPERQPPREPGGGGGGDRQPSADARPAPRPGSFDSLDRPFEWPFIPRTWLAQSRPSKGGGGAPDGGPGSPSKERDARRKRLEADLAKLTKREQHLLAELQKRGVVEGGESIPSDFAEPLNSLAHPDSKQVTLWTHDLSVKPGVAYRYRARVRITNPFFRQEDRLKPAQKALAAPAVIVSPSSEWSEPIRVDPPVLYFITSATEAGGPLASPARAAAEVYEFYYGYWRRGGVSLSPGDPIVATVDLPELITFSLERDPSGRLVIKDRPAVPKQRLVRADAFLIDTASSVAGGTGGAQAYLRDETGRLVVRQPVSAGEEARRRAACQSSALIGQSSTLREPGTGLPTAPPPAGDQDQGPTPPPQAPAGGQPGGGDPGKPKPDKF